MDGRSLGACECPDAGNGIDAATIDVLDATASVEDADAPGDSGAAIDVTTPDTPPPDVDRTYPPGPYGTSVGSLMNPIELTGCNGAYDGLSWNFARDGFFEATLTFISIDAGWCVPCQNQTMQMQTQIVERYAGQGVRVVQVMVQNPDRAAVTPAFCRVWASRYGLIIPELMDPTFITQPFVPNTAFPGAVIVDRCGRIRWREYGSSMGLSSIRAAIDGVLADPRYPSCP